MVDREWRLEAGDQTCEPEGQPHGYHPASQGERQAFGHHLPDQPPSACTHRQPNGDLPTAGRGASQHHVGQVGARDQQNESHRSEEDQAHWCESPVEFGVDRDVIGRDDLDGL